MPELPEVEVTRLGLLPVLQGRQVSDVCVRVPRLREPVSPKLADVLNGGVLTNIRRRGKYLLFDFSGDQPGHLILHLGMSGSVRLIRLGTPLQKHDHVDLVFGDTVLRLRDPRRFGLLVWTAEPAERHPLLMRQGIEPLSDGFSGEWLFNATRRRSVPVKPLLMDSRTLVGVGNIYAAESLFHAGIAPHVLATDLSRQGCDSVVLAIKSVLAAAIAAGGCSVRDYVHSDGGVGCFQLACYVYGRLGKPCRRCQQPIVRIAQGGRSTFYCPKCQQG